ncbi:MAG: T9SS type A sorting domain-containing protein [Bacteroidetes bacterium]|nr:T9SS type A sorting domain-containing protein [Bacteroidota bacterium]
MRVFRIFIIWFLAGISGSLFASTNVSGYIYQKVTWTAAGSPYYLTDNVIVKDTAGITVEPGVRIIATGDYHLQVFGQLRALGTKDSMISFESMTVEFALGSKPYQVSDNSGSMFRYCRFTAFAQSGHNIITASIGLNFENCIFDFGYISVYNISSFPGIHLRATNCLFYYKTSGYPFYGNTQKSSLYLVGNTFKRLTVLNLLESNFIHDNYFETGSDLMNWQTSTKNADIQCNNFYHGNIGINFHSNVPWTGKAVVKNNLFDSCRIAIRFDCRITNTDSFDIQNNWIITKEKAIEFNESCSGTGSYQWVYFGKNYFGTTDTNKILAVITDYRKAQTIPFKVQISGFLTVAPVDCWPDTPLTITTNKITQPDYIECNVYPNPASGGIHLDFAHPGNYFTQLLDLKGNILVEKSISGMSCEFNLSDISEGIYLLRISGAGISETRRIQIQH